MTTENTSVMARPGCAQIAGHGPGVSTSATSISTTAETVSDHDQINHDLLLLRRHLALLTTTPTEPNIAGTPHRITPNGKGADTEVVYARVVKQPKRCPKICEQFDVIPTFESYNASSTTATAGIQRCPTSTSRFYGVLSPSDSIIRNEHNTIWLDTNQAISIGGSGGGGNIGHSSLPTAGVFDDHQLSERHRLASTVLSDSIHRLSNDPTTPLSSSSLPVIIVLENGAQNASHSSPTSVHVTLLLSAIKWTFALASDCQEPCREMALSTFYVSHTRRVNLLSHNELHNNSSTAAFSQPCSNTQTAVELLEQSLARLTLLVAETNEEYIFSFSIHATIRGDTTKANRCAVSIVKCFPAIESDSESLSLWRILEILARSNSGVRDEDGGSAGSHTKARTSHSNRSHRNSGHSSSSNSDYGSRSLRNLDSCLTGSESHLVRKSHIFQLFVSLIRDPAVSLSVVAKLSSPEVTSSEWPVWLRQQWHCLCALSRANFVMSTPVTIIAERRSNAQQQTRSANLRKLSIGARELVSQIPDGLSVCPSPKQPFLQRQHRPQPTPHGTASSEQSLETVIFRGKTTTTSTTHQENMRGCVNQSISANSVKRASEQSGQQLRCKDKLENSGELKQNNANTKDNIALDNGRMSKPGSSRRSTSRSRRNSSYSYETNSSKDTKSRWQSERRHRAHHSGQSHGHLLHQLRQHSVRSRKSKRRRSSSGKTLTTNGLWAEEIWVDGPLATDLETVKRTPKSKQNSPKPAPVASSSGVIVVPSPAPISQATDFRDKHTRIEQWIASNSQHVTHDAANGEGHSATRWSSSTASSPAPPVRRPSIVPNCSNRVVDCDTRTELTIDTSPNMAEPPKQLRLEQFLAQLSTLTTSPSASTNDANTLDKYSTSQILLPENRLRQEVGGRVSDGSSIAPSFPTIRPLNIGSETHKQQSKLKRNTTSTTTSGHGTVSEGECSSIVPSTNTNKRSNGRHQTSTPSVSTTPGSGVDAAVQRQQPTTSSGYESTVQDDVDEIDEDERINRTTNLHTIELAQVPTITALWPNELTYKTTRLACTTDPNRTGSSGAITTTTVLHSGCETTDDMDSPSASNEYCSLFCCAIRKSAKRSDAGNNRSLDVKQQKSTATIGTLESRTRRR